MSETDQARIERALRGETSAFESLVRAYQDRLYHAMLALLNVPEDAEDVVQEAFLQAFRKLAQFRGDSAFYSWLFRIALNLVHTRRRQRKPMPISFDHNPEHPLDPVDSSGPSVDAGLLSIDQAALVRAALEELPWEFREVLVLRDMEDQDYESIANALEIPLGTVRSRLHRARQAFQERFTAKVCAEERT